MQIIRHCLLALVGLTACGEDVVKASSTPADMVASQDVSEVETTSDGVSDVIATTDVVGDANLDLDVQDTGPAEVSQTDGDIQLHADLLDDEVGQSDCSADADCNTTESCQVALCLAQVCKVVAVPTGTPCDDGNACTTGEKCSGTTCQGGTAVVCDDGSPCTTDTCDQISGCKQQASSGASCDDNDACTTDDVCVNGTCAGVALDCDDSNVCTTDYCGGGTCQHGDAPDGTTCDDSDPCTVSACDDGVCIAKPKLWSTPLATGLVPNQLVATPVGVVVVSSKWPDHVLSWYDSLGAKVKEEVGTTRFVALTPAGNLVHAREGVIAMTDVWGTQLWSTTVPAIVDELGTGLPSYTKIYAAGDGCYAVGTVQTDKYLRTAVARLSYSGVVEWQLATSPESSGEFQQEGTPLSGGGFLLSTTTRFFIPDKSTMFLTRFDKSGVIQAGPTYIPGLPKVQLASRIDQSAFAALNASLYKVTPELEVTALSSKGGEGWIGSAPGGLGVLRSSKLQQLDKDGEVLTSAMIAISGPKMFSFGDGSIYLLSNVLGPGDSSWLLHRLDQNGNHSCGVCMQAPGSCNDNLSCTLDECSSTAGCSNKPNNCDDGLPCTLDACSQASGCSHAPLELGAACSDDTVCTSDDACNNGKCVGVAACPASLCNTTSCNQYEGKPKCNVYPHLAGTACAQGGRCSADQICETDFCESSIVVPGISALVAKQAVDLPFDVTLTYPVKWVRLQGGGSNEATLLLKFNNETYGYRAYPSSGLRSGSYFAGEYPYGFKNGDNVPAPEGLVPTGLWTLRAQGSQYLNGTGFLEPTTVSFGYQCPSP